MRHKREKETHFRMAYFLKTEVLYAEAIKLKEIMYTVLKVISK